MLLRKASSMNTARIEKQIDGKLNDQFRYFRREFMEAASAQGVTMPLELVEDKSGRFFTFVNANGPRYLLQIIHSQPEASAIMRCAISLLIVTMAILRRKLPENRPKAAGTNWMSQLGLTDPWHHIRWRLGLDLHQPIGEVENTCHSGAGAELAGSAGQHLRGGCHSNGDTAQSSADNSQRNGRKVQER